MKVVVVMSGGLDSATLAYSLGAEGHSLDLISFDYGQRHRRELKYAERLAHGLNASWTLIDLQAAGIAKLLKGSALTDEAVDVPDGHYAAENMRVTVVPNRNAVMLAIAFAAAGGWAANAVAIAVHAGDHPIYPDCRPEFIASFEAMERLAMKGTASVRILAPFLSSTKADIVRLGAQLGVPFAETWSCYKGGAVHCGACGTCYERREAFQLAGVLDPTEYLATPVFDAP